MATIEQEFQEVRRLLNNPKEQKPSSDLLIAGLVRQMQFMMNRLNGSGRGWTSNSAQVTVQADTAEYTLYADDPTNSTPLSQYGKTLFAYRELSGNVIVPVPVTDYTNELSNQGYEEVIIPSVANVYPGAAYEKLAFFRAGGVPKMRVYPVPSDERVYKFIYATGALDWSAFTWSTEMEMPEWSFYKCLAVALFEIERCEWSGMDADANNAYRTRLGRSLETQLKVQEGEFNAYLNNPQHESTIDTIGAWYER